MVPRASQQRIRVAGHLALAAACLVGLIVAAISPPTAGAGIGAEAVAVTLAVDQAAVAQGDPLTFTATAECDGLGGVDVTVEVPDGIVAEAGTANNGATAVVGQTWTWSPTVLVGGGPDVCPAVATFGATVDPSTAGLLTATLTATAQLGGPPSTASADVFAVPLGDANCSGVLTLFDARLVALVAIEAAVDDACPKPNANTPLHVPAGDIDRNGATSLGDARWIALCAIEAIVDGCPDPVAPPPTPEPPPPLDEFILMDRAAIAALPTTGVAWEHLKGDADLALTIPLDVNDPDSPRLTNYDDSGDLKRKTTRMLAAALVVASDWDGDKEPYRTKVAAYLRFIMGTEELPSTDGTADFDGWLAAARQLPPVVLAADFIDFDGSTTGSRPGWTDVSFDAWLADLQTKRIGTHGRWYSMQVTSEDSSTNQGARARSTLVAIQAWFGDDAGLARSATIMRGQLGDPNAYPAWPDGQRPPVGEGFQTSASFDPTWACNYDPVSPPGFLPINDGSCGPELDGVIVEDMSRSAGSYSPGNVDFDDTGVGYQFEALGGHYSTALVLERAGYDVFAWSDQALLRSVQWLERNGQIADLKPWSPRPTMLHLANHFYGASFDTLSPAGVDRGIGYVDWLYPLPG